MVGLQRQDASGAMALACIIALAAFRRLLFWRPAGKNRLAIATFFAAIAVQLLSPQKDLPLAVAALAMGAAMGHKMEAVHLSALSLHICGAIGCAIFPQCRIAGTAYAIGALGSAGIFPFCIGAKRNLIGAESAIMVSLCRHSYLLCAALAAPPPMNLSAALPLAALSAAFAALLANGDRFIWRAASSVANFSAATSFAAAIFPATRHAAIVCFLSTQLAQMQLAFALPRGDTLEERELKSLICKNRRRAICVALQWTILCLSPIIVFCARSAISICAAASALAIFVACLCPFIFLKMAVRIVAIVSTGSCNRSYRHPLEEKFSGTATALAIGSSAAILLASFAFSPFRI
ncbi:MAG: hypothetical protein LBI39_04045 [Puniceicoccales bacterium]|nr:hypothetical protein [Puniceicoccales bacterium]